MAVAEEIRAQVNFSLASRPTLAKRIDAASQRLDVPTGTLCRDIVETFLDAYVEWAERAASQRREALEAIQQAARMPAAPSRFPSRERA